MDDEADGLQVENKETGDNYAAFDTLLDETMYSKGDGAPALNRLSNVVFCLFAGSKSMPAWA